MSVQLTNLRERTMSPAAFAPFLHLPGLAALARDEHMRLLWCTPNVGALFGAASPADMLGTDLSRTMPAYGVSERDRFLRHTMDTGVPQEVPIMGRGISANLRVFPLDVAAFGARGVFLIASQLLPTEPSSHAAPSPDLGDLSHLSRRELEVLYWLAQGLDSHEIAAKIARSSHTVQDHIKSLHAKLRVSTRGELVALAVSRGIPAFTPQTWQRIALEASMHRGIVPAKSVPLAGRAPGSVGAPDTIASDDPMQLISPRDFEPLDGLPGMCALARDGAMRLLWCNDTYARENDRTREQLVGSTVHDVLPSRAADERVAMMRPTLERGVCTQFAQMWKGARWITRVLPLHPQAFGCNGLFVLLVRAPLIADHDLPHGTLQFIKSAHFGELASLTRRELETLYELAHGLDVPDIAAKLRLSPHTVGDYVKALHAKLGVNSRGELVKKAVGLGITGFTSDEWQEIAVYANQARETH